MTHYVVDASVGTKWLVPEDLAANAESLYRSDAGLIAPSHWPIEIGNAIWKKCRLRRDLSRSEALQALELLRTLRVRTYDLDALRDDAFRLALDHGITVHDALYVALAVRESCQFITAEERLVSTLRPSFSTVVLSLAEFASADG